MIGYSADLTVLNISAGSPGSGWSASLIEKWAIPAGGFSITSGYGSDGVSLQVRCSFGAIAGWGSEVLRPRES